jgi:hypothetical protein
LRKNVIATGAVVGALLLGSAGAALVLPSLAAAADPSASPAASPSAPGAPSRDGGAMGGHGFGGTTEAVSDASVVAKAIGITETELNTALQGGQTIAAVAKAHNVDVQKVIDALVADKKDEIAAAVKAGTLTQAQADQQLANVTQFATDQVNSTGFGGGRGHGGPGGHGFGGPNEAVSDTSVAAKAIGISESDLTTALQGGKSIADVAKANNGDVQKVIDALVADGKDELAAAVKAGTITQTQADQEASNLTARVTAQVNGTGFGPGGHGPGGRPNDNDADDAPSASPSTGTGTSG